MTKQVNIHAAKTNFSKLVEEVEAGAEIVIARSGKPVMRLVKFVDDKPKRTLGFAAGKFASFTKAEWQAMDEKIAATFDKN